METKQTMQLLLAKGSVVEPDHVESWMTASFVALGQPLKGYDGTVECLTCDRWVRNLAGTMAQLKRILAKEARN